MSGDSFDAFRKKLKQRHADAGGQAAGGGAGDAQPSAEGDGDGSPAEANGEGALARMRAARARLDSLKKKSAPGAEGGAQAPREEERADAESAEEPTGSPSGPADADADESTADESETVRPTAADLFRAGRARAAGREKPAAAPVEQPADDSAGGLQGGLEAAKARLGAGKQPGARKLGAGGPLKPKLGGQKLGGQKPGGQKLGGQKLGGQKPGGAARPGARRESGGARATRTDAATGDGFESFRRAKADASFEDAKRRAFTEGVEVEGLDRSRLAADRVEKKSAEELGVTRHPMVHTFKKEELIGEGDPLADSISGERPELFDTHRSRRLTTEELGELEKPEHFETHRAKRQNVEDLDIEPPERLTSHRHKRKKSDPLADDADENGTVEIEGFKRFEF